MQTCSRTQVVLTLTKPVNGRPDRVAFTGRYDDVVAFALRFAPYERMLDCCWPDARAALDMLGREGAPR